MGTKTHLAKRLQELMDANKLSERALSRATKIPLSTLRGGLAGREISIRHVITLAKHFSCSTDFLLFSDDPTKHLSIDQLDLNEIFEGLMHVRLSKVRGFKK